MSTAKQRAANQENCKKSTGPVTPEGKAISSRNRVSAGFNSTTIYFLESEKEDQFWQLLDDFTTQYQPANTTEQVLVEKMVHNHWLSLRAIRLQKERLCFRASTDPIPQDLGLLIRYQNSADRTFFKAQTELVKAQKERQKSEIGFVSQNLEPVPVPAPQPVPEPVAEVPQQPLAEPPTAPETPAPSEFIANTKDLLSESVALLAEYDEFCSQAA